MTARNDDRLLTTWLHDVAPQREPEHLLGQVLARTARTRRRSAWRIPERWISMSAITSRFTPATPISWRLIAVAAALLLALVAGLALLASGNARAVAPPYGLASNGRVAYSVDGDIVVADAPNAAPRTLLGGVSDDRLPLYSLDGSRLVFVRGPESAMEVWTAAADGSDQRLLLPASDWLPWIDWSPDAGSLVVSELASEDARLQFVPLNGSDPTTIDTGLDAVTAAAFRPVAGAQISFRGRDASDWGFYLADRDGTNLVRLALDTGFTSDANYADDAPYYFLDLTWASSGSRIAFHTLEPDPTSPAGPGFRVHVADIDPAGAVSNERILEFNPANDDEFAPIFIPGTDDIVFQTLEGQTHRLFRASTLPGAGPAIDLGIVAQEFIAVTVAPDGKTLLVAIPDGPTVVQLDLASLSQTPIGIPEEFSWQRAPVR